MGKIYCTECGTELDSSAKFCSSCGTSVNNNANNVKDIVINDDSIDGLMDKIELSTLLTGVIIVVICHLAGIFTGNLTVIFAITVAPFLVGFLSDGSIKLVMVYAMLLSFVSTILFCMFPHGFADIEEILLIFVFMFLFAFIGNLIKSKS